MSNRTEHDVLTGLMKSYELNASIYANPSVCGAWQIGGRDEEKQAVFHLIGRGHGWLHMHNLDQPLALNSGDLVVFPHNDWHMISPDPTLRDDQRHIVNDGTGPVTSLVCGMLEFRLGARNPIVDALPALIFVRADQGGEQLGLVARLLAAEADAAEYGHQLVLDKLADALFVMAIRHYIAHADDRRGLVAGLADRRLGKALAAMHAEPGHPWQVAELAEQAGMSRTAFSNHFGQVIGESPISYLTQWRMRRAEIELRRGATVAALTDRFGYQTEAAFRKAFKRVTGRSPGTARKRS